MGSVAGAIWFVRSVYPEPAPFFAATDQSLLAAPGVVSKPRGLLAEPRHFDHALCLSTVLARRKTPLDRWHGAAGTRAGGESQVLAGGGHFALRHPRAHPALLLHA